MTELEKDCLKVLVLIKKTKDSNFVISTEEISGTPLSGTLIEILERNSNELSMDLSRLSIAIDYLTKNSYIINSKSHVTNYFRISENLGLQYLVELERRKEENELRIRAESERIKNQDESVRVSMSESRRANRISLAALIVAIIAVTVTAFKEEKASNVDLSNYVTKDALKNYVTNDKLKTYSDSTIIDLIDHLCRDNKKIDQFSLKK